MLMLSCALVTHKPLALHFALKVLIHDEVLWGSPTKILASETQASRNKLENPQRLVPREYQSPV
jgi:hypothetical protein